ncbi:uncharacterized protein J3D65DRAFT_127688 [Phyllosticta citribraziliensis]|uniref:Uncharacterized protein n=1 Tax=Phyllosticta citribraziliensis TaxID=989973 RepID=A0ABR1LDM4_9PEZI
MDSNTSYSKSNSISTFSSDHPPTVNCEQPTQQTNNDNNTKASTSDTETVNISTSTTENPSISNIPNATTEHTTVNKTKTKPTNSLNSHFTLATEFLAVLSDYTEILSRIEHENAALLAAYRLIATSRARMTRAFNDVAKARQRMARLFERAREQQIQQTQASEACAGSDDADTMKALQLDARRWDIMRGYERLYRERKRVEREMLSVEKDKERRVDAEWVLAMFSRVAEKGLFEAPVVVERREGRGGEGEGDLDDEDGGEEEEEESADEQQELV